MLTSPPPPPASLPPPRRHTGRRLNRILGIFFIIGGCVVAASISYTLYEKSEDQARRRQLTQTAPSGGDALAVLKDAPSGFIAPAAYGRPEAPPKVERERLKETEKTNDTKPPPQPDDNGLEHEREEAWKRHWDEYDKVHKQRFEKRFEALTAMKTSVEVGGRGSAETAGPSSPAAAPVAASHAPANPAWGGGAGLGGGLPGLGGFPGFGLGPTAQIDREGQEQKIDFAEQKGDLGKNDVVPTVRKPPDPYAVMAGSFVKFTTINEVNSDVPGSTIGMVTESVYNNSNGTCVLIPSGSKLIGHYNSVISTGQSRLPGVLTRIIFPDGSSQAIGAMEMADNAGSAGMDDQINRHLIQKFGSAAIAGLFGAGIYLAVPHNTGFNNGIDATQIIGASLAQQIGQTGQQITQQNLSIPNTITIRAGYNGTMITDKDIHMQPWSCGDSGRAAALPIMSVSQ